MNLIAHTWTAVFIILLLGSVVQLALWASGALDAWASLRYLAYAVAVWDLLGAASLLSLRYVDVGIEAV